MRPPCRFSSQRPGRLSSHEGCQVPDKPLVPDNPKRPTSDRILFVLRSPLVPRNLAMVGLFMAFSLGGAFSRASTSESVPIEWFFATVDSESDQAQKALDGIEKGWNNSYAAMLLDLLPILPRTKGRTKTESRLIRLLEQKTGIPYSGDLKQWREWTWKQPYEPHPQLASFKGRLYGRIDARMGRFFPRNVRSIIRLDEVEWGGVPVNGIPPLRYPAHLPASEAGYLEESNIVFGVAMNGKARAYPKRILAWHEMARDRLGGVEITIVYCTLCGTAIPYGSEVGGRLRQFGTSGLLYRSNKLMFDEGTMSLWSTLEGKPVVGKLVGSDLELTPHPIVTTTWGEWSKMHPDTTVLSINTGHSRDYSEGAAYRDYFSTDRLMFTVSKKDDRLSNKAEVLTLLLAHKNGRKERFPLAISAKFLNRHRVYHAEEGGQRLVVITSSNGANRVYRSDGVRFDRQSGEGSILDDRGRSWQVTEEALILASDPEVRLTRLPAQRAFWFGWYAQFPETKLIK